MPAGEKADALEIAMRTENEGMAMYREAGEKAASPLARKMFLGLAEDEKAHLGMIEEIARGMGMSAALEIARKGTPLGRMKTIFADAKSDVIKRMAPSAGEFEAIRIALDFEQQGYGFYTRAAQDAADQDQKALFEKLALEENEHHRILESTLDYLEDTGKWFLWDEWGLLTGDMSAGG